MCRICLVSVGAVVTNCTPLSKLSLWLMCQHIPDYVKNPPSLSPSHLHAETWLSLTLLLWLCMTRAQRFLWCFHVSYKLQRTFFTERVMLLLSEPFWSSTTGFVLTTILSGCCVTVPDRSNALFDSTLGKWRPSVESSFVTFPAAGRILSLCCLL